MIASKRLSQRYIRLFGICCVVMMITGSDGATNEPILHIPWPHGGTLLVHTVDWYKPPRHDPEETPSSERLAIPTNLIEGLPRRLHREAITLLGDADVVEITKEQAKHFSAPVEPDSVLRSLIQKNKKEIQRYQNNIAELKSGRSQHYSSAQAKMDAKIDEDLITENNVENRQYKSWMGGLKPYLIKAVAFSYDQQNFSGYLISNDLVITFGAVLDGPGTLSMKRMPAVAYLPKKPQRVFTNMRNLD
jgi:hypothetical protein